MSERDKDAKQGPAPVTSSGTERPAPGRSSVRSRYGQGGAAPAGPAAPAAPAAAPSAPPPPPPPPQDDGDRDAGPSASFDSAFELGGESPVPRARSDRESDEDERPRWLQNKPAPGSGGGATAPGIADEAVPGSDTEDEDRDD